MEILPHSLYKYKEGWNSSPVTYYGLIPISRSVPSGKRPKRMDRKNTRGLGSSRCLQRRSHASQRSNPLRVRMIRNSIYHPIGWLLISSCRIFWIGFQSHFQYSGEQSTETKRTASGMQTVIHILSDYKHKRSLHPVLFGQEKEELLQCFVILLEALSLPALLLPNSGIQEVSQLRDEGVGASRGAVLQFQLLLY